MNNDMELTVYEFDDKPITMEQKRDYFFRKLGNILKLVLSVLVVVICAIVTAWMVYNIVTTGSAFPTDLIMSSSSNMISKGIKGF